MSFSFVPSSTALRLRVITPNATLPKRTLRRTQLSGNLQRQRILPSGTPGLFRLITVHFSILAQMRWIAPDYHFATRTLSLLDVTSLFDQGDVLRRRWI